MAFYVLTDFYNDRKYDYEREYVYIPSLSFLENILTYFNQPKSELHKVREHKADDGSVEEVFSIKGVLGKETTFSIRKYKGGFLFGWRLEECLQQRSWQYIVRDIMGHYSSGFF
jgi:hypothetical protein